LKPILTSLLLAPLLVALGACNGTEPIDETLVAPVPAPAVKPAIECSAMPPLKDKSKLKQLLLKRGLITQEMSQEQQDAEVAAYIRKRQRAFETCRKESKQ
jgi:hypothetical protein